MLSNMVGFITFYYFQNYNETRCAVEATLTSNGCSSGDIVRHPEASITKIKVCNVLYHFKNK